MDFPGAWGLHSTAALMSLRAHQPPRLLRSWRAWASLLSATVVMSACVQARPATDTGDPGFPFGPSAVGVQTIAYTQDIKPIFDRDCASCHGARQTAGNYSVTTYANVLAGQHPGDASSSLVVDCSPGGSMYRYFSGDAVTEATMVFRWMVYYNAAQTR
jgi:mono/diheme cytochrome c family protein